MVHQSLQTWSSTQLPETASISSALLRFCESVYTIHTNISGGVFDLLHDIKTIYGTPPTPSDVDLGDDDQDGMHQASGNEADASDADVYSQTDNIETPPDQFFVVLTRIFQIVGDITTKMDYRNKLNALDIFKADGWIETLNTRVITDIVASKNMLTNDLFEFLNTSLLLLQNEVNDFGSSYPLDETLLLKELVYKAVTYLEVCKELFTELELAVKSNDIFTRFEHHYLTNTTTFYK